MTVIGYNAKLLRDQDGNNMYYSTNSITLGGGESLDVILDATDTQYPAGSVFYLYTRTSIICRTTPRTSAADDRGPYHHLEAAMSAAITRKAMAMYRLLPYC